MAKPAAKTTNKGTKRSRSPKSEDELVARLETEILPLSEVEPHPDNPKTHPLTQVDQVADLINKVGYAAGSMTIQKSRKRLVKGHCVYAALTKLGYHAAEFVSKEMTDDEAMIFMIADNKLAEKSSWSGPQLLVNFSNLKVSGAPLESTGFKMNEIERMQNGGLKFGSGAIGEAGKKTEAEEISCPKCGHTFFEDSI